MPRKMRQRAGLVSSRRYEIIELDAFTKDLRKLFERGDQERIRKAVEAELRTDPKRCELLEGRIEVRGVSIFGLRKLRVSVRGHRGGARVLFRLCEECLQFGYYLKSDKRCEFCLPRNPERVVLFAARPRSIAY